MPEAETEQRPDHENELPVHVCEATPATRQRAPAGPGLPYERPDSQQLFRGSAPTTEVALRRV